MELLLSPVARVVIGMLGEAPLDQLHETEYDFGELVKEIERERRKAFHRAWHEATFTKGLSVSPFFVSSNPGYVGTYLN